MNNWRRISPSRPMGISSTSLMPQRVTRPRIRPDTQMSLCMSAPSTNMRPHTLKISSTRSVTPTQKLSQKLIEDHKGIQEFVGIRTLDQSMYSYLEQSLLV